MRDFTPISRKLLTAAALSCSFALSSAPAAVLTLNVVDDTYIQSDNAVAFFQEANHGGDPTMTLASFGSKNLLLRFDTTGLGALTGATINSVQLNFTLTSGSLTAPSNLLLAQLTNANSDWVEGTGTGFGNTVAGADNFIRNGTNPTGTPWAGTSGAAGGTNSATSGVFFDLYAATLYSLGSVTSSGSTLTLTLSSAVITNWMADPTAALAGLALSNVGGGSDINFRSVEGGIGFPTVTVDYTAVPEPSTGALLGLGMVGFLCLSRRKASRRAGRLFKIQLHR
jgi:hypothetical protein